MRGAAELGLQGPSRNATVPALMPWARAAPAMEPPRTTWTKL